MSVGMSLVFNAASRLEGIVGVYAGSNDAQIAKLVARLVAYERPAPRFSVAAKKHACGWRLLATLARIN